MPKRVLPLSDEIIDNAKAKTKAYKLSDGFGLYILITPSGGKLWQMQYRFLGQPKVLSFGSYPIVSLADARQKRTDARMQLAKGLDPAQVKKQEKEAKRAEHVDTFEAVARDWFNRFKPLWTERYAARILTQLEKDIFPILGQSPIAEIKTPDVLRVFREIEKRSLEMAHKARLTCRQIFRYAVATGAAERDLVDDLQGFLRPRKNKPSAAPTDPKDVATLMRGLDCYEGSFVVRCALQLAPLLLVRPGVLRHAEWPEINFTDKEWKIPAEKMKTKEDHIVPLPRQAIAILRLLHDLTGNGKYVFPCRISPLRCMSDNAVTAALRSLGYEKDFIVGYGFQAMARTMLAEVLKFRIDIIEHQLGHIVNDRNGKGYPATMFLKERRQMVQAWADYLDQLKKQPDASQDLHNEYTGASGAMIIAFNQDSIHR